MTIKLLDHWTAPAGAGAPTACLATSFTFDPQFFTDDCLSRFLALTAVTGEGDKIDSIAAVIEEEWRLSETTAVSVLVDRGTPADKRNLRWDLLPVAVPRGLLHAKTVILVWENHARIVVGSANLTPAGYRSQIETAVAFDIADGCAVPAGFLREVLDEIESYLDLLPSTGAEVSRARGTIALARDRVSSHAPSDSRSNIRFAAAPASPGNSPLDAYTDAWGSTHKPLRATVIAPFWDSADSTAIDELRAQLTGRPATSRSVTAVVGQDRIGFWQAPPELAGRVDSVRALATVDGEQRTLHAKVLLLENDDWVAALVGSSNATVAGWGLHPVRGHRELNVWIGASRNSKEGRALRALARTAERIDLSKVDTVLDDEDETSLPPLPLFFAWCVLAVDRSTAKATFTFDTSTTAPTSWSVSQPSGPVILDKNRWAESGGHATTDIEVNRESVPSVFDVQWSDASGTYTATWVANIQGTDGLPPPEELAGLSADLLLRALASTRPFIAAIEHQLRQADARAKVDGDPLDPLRRFDSSGLLLHRTRARSAALWEMKARLNARTRSIEVLRNRLYGVVGPLTIVQKLVAEASNDLDTVSASPTELHFLIAEIALTIGAVDWGTATRGIDPGLVRDTLISALEELESAYAMPDSTPRNSQMTAYVAQAFEEARRSCGG